VIARQLLVVAQSFPNSSALQPQVLPSNNILYIEPNKQINQLRVMCRKEYYAKPIKLYISWTMDILLTDTNYYDLDPIPTSPLSTVISNQQQTITSMLMILNFLSSSALDFSHNITHFENTILLKYPSGYLPIFPFLVS